MFRLAQMSLDGLTNTFIQQWIVDADVPGGPLNRVTPLPGAVA